MISVSFVQKRSTSRLLGGIVDLIVLSDFRMLIIENFIPPEDKMKVQTRATFDEDEDMWKLAPLSKAR